MQDFNYPCHSSVDKWWYMQIYCCGFSNDSAHKWLNRLCNGHISIMPLNTIFVPSISLCYRPYGISEIGLCMFVKALASIWHHINHPCICQWSGGWFHIKFILQLLALKSHRLNTQIDGRRAIIEPEKSSYILSSFEKAVSQLETNLNHIYTPPNKFSNPCWSD